MNFLSVMLVVLFILFGVHPAFSDCDKSFGTGTLNAAFNSSGVVRYKHMGEDGLSARIELGGRLAYSGPVQIHPRHSDSMSYVCNSEIATVETLQSGLAIVLLDDALVLPQWNNIDGEVFYFQRLSGGCDVRKRSLVNKMDVFEKYLSEECPNSSNIKEFSYEIMQYHEFEFRSVYAFCDDVIIFEDGSLANPIGSNFQNYPCSMLR